MDVRLTLVTASRESMTASQKILTASREVVTASQAIREELGETAMILILREPEAWHQGARDQQQHRGQAEGQV